MAKSAQGGKGKESGLSEYCREVLDSLHDGVVALDGEGRIVFWSRAASAIAGVTGGLIAGVKLAEAKLPEFLGRAMERVAKAAIEGRDVSETVRDFSSTGTKKLVILTARRDRRGEGAYVTIVMRDETERQQLQEKMIETQKLEALGRLVGGVAHDFNNCFAGILGYVSLLKQMTSAGTEAAEYSEAIEQSARRAAEITANLLSFARRQPEDREPIIVSFLVGETLALAAETFPKRLVVQTDFSTDLPPVTVSPGRIQQAVLNVLLAACDAMPHGGTLTVATRRVGDFRSPGRRAGRPAVEISITHTGTAGGVAGEPGALELFLALEGACEDSLALAAAHGILHAHGGTLDIVAGASGGATFTIHIPTGGEKEAAEGAATAAAGEGPLVLAIVDDPVLGGLAAEILMRNGYTVETATAGTAIEAAGRLAERVKAVLVDVKDMGTIGREIVEIIRERIGEAPVVVCTSQQEDKAASWALSLARAALLVKPFSSSDLLAAMSRAVAAGS